MVDDFTLYNKSEDLINYVNIYVFSSFPKAHLSLKINFENEMYDLLRNISRASFTKGNVRQKYITDSLVNVSLMDTFIGIIRDYSIIINKRFQSILRKLKEIKYMLLGWRSASEK